MNVLGIFGFSYNPAACLIQDGQLVAFIEEERLTRLKGSDGMFPAKSVAHCMSMAGLKLSDIHAIAFGWDASKYPWVMLQNFGKNYLKYRGKVKPSAKSSGSSASVMSALRTLTKFHSAELKVKIMDGIRAAGLMGNIPPIHFIEHHLAHAYSTYFMSGFDRAGILTLDGSGENLCTQLAIGVGKDLTTLESFQIPHSLGWFYAGITEYLGFIPHRDEGKVMGLAALGEERRAQNPWLEPLSKVLMTHPQGYEVNPIYTQFGGHYYGRWFTDALVDLLTAVDPKAAPIAYGEKIMVDGVKASKYLQPVYVDIAWAAQELLERAAVGLAKRLVTEQGVKNLCIAGGVGLNCKMNGEILRQSGCENIFVQPAANDAGVALGAAMVVAKAGGDNIQHPLHNIYTGPEYSNDEIRTALNNCGVNYIETDDPSTDAANFLAAGKIVSWFQGRMEVGSRALGNRSILANPAYPDIKNKVNERVKYRESWRPFCPSMTDEAKNRYIQGPNDVAHMIVAYQVPAGVEKSLPGIVHVDGTIRPQAVTQAKNPRFHALITELGKQTGHPVVMNTSFNVRSEPIVCTPLDAVRCFYSNGLDALVMGNFVLTKSKAS